MHTRSDHGAISRLAALDVAACRDLSARAIEPNGYYLPEWAQAVNGHARHAHSAALTAVDAGSGAMIGFLPVNSAWRTYRLPLPALVSADPYRSLDTPLLDRDRADAAAVQMLDRARDAGAHALILRLMPLDGDAAGAFTRALASKGLRPRILKHYMRACLDATGDADELLRDALGAKKVKELRRQRNRLGEHGKVTFTMATRPSEVAVAFDTFLALEASGWKGRRGTAMAQNADDAARVRDAAISLAAQRQCEIAMLHAGTTPVAAGIVLRHLDRAFFFKLGIDERFAKISPGVQLTLELTRHLCADPEITTADSTAAPDHPMIDPIWRGRLAIGDLLIPLRRHDPVLPVIAAALHGHAFARAVALKMLRR